MTQPQSQIDIPEAPDGWHWGIGERLGETYTHWLYTDAVLYNTPDARDRLFGYEITVYHDVGNRYHYATLIPIESWAGEDPSYGYEERIGEYDTEKEAIDAAVEFAGDLR